MAKETKADEPKKYKVTFTQSTGPYSNVTIEDEATAEEIVTKGHWLYNQFKDIPKN